MVLNIVGKHEVTFLYSCMALATLKWVDWFNNRRLLEPIGNIPPAEAEELYYNQINQLELVA